MDVIDSYPADVRDQLVQRIDGAFDAASEFSAERAISLREAALCSGIERVAEAHVTRGLYP